MKYFSEIWNLFDISLAVLYYGYVCAQLIQKNYDLTVLECAIVIVSFLKLTFYLRIFDGLGFLVQMIVSVLKDLTNFLLFFCLFVVFCGIFMTIIMKNISGDYPETHGLGTFILAFRMSIGDFSTDSFSMNDNQRLLTWGIWIALMLFGNVIFMNFIIAVVSESYENCMSKMFAQSYKVKLDMIVEKESIMTDEELENNEFFPNYILLRSPIDNSGNSGHW